MTQEQAEKAMDRECEVECKGIVYKRIKSVIITKLNGSRHIQVEMLDKCGHSVTIDAVENVKEAKEEVEIPF